MGRRSSCSGPPALPRTSPSTPSGAARVWRSTLPTFTPTAAATAARRPPSRRSSRIELVCPGAW
eukprot:14872665-Alexandrium_andersonii.AAC.1